jgi:hypothetical protein
VQAQHTIAQTAASDDEHDIQSMLLGRTEETFPRNLRYGALATIYATVEQSIRSACYLTGDVLGAPFAEPRGGMPRGDLRRCPRAGPGPRAGAVDLAPAFRQRVAATAPPSHAVAHAAPLGGPEIDAPGLLLAPSLREKGA